MRERANRTVAAQGANLENRSRALDFRDEVQEFPCNGETSYGGRPARPFAWRHSSSTGSASTVLPRNTRQPQSNYLES